ncbi:MAG TPA: hypothetical protein ENJ20_03855 [Bacteroidetes bacterium]|nr:hypothetical protein [Bacteroidota bacterium]
MKNLFLFTVCYFLSVSLCAQTGIRFSYSNFTATEWTDLINEATGKRYASPTGYYIGVDYWLRLKQKRIEFFPEAGYGLVKADLDQTGLEIRSFGFHLNTNVYPFDFAGDCDCPTWSKEGGILKKGFFFQLSPGVVRSDIKVNDPIVVQNGNATYFHLGFGAGLDIGLSDFLTITPLVKYYISPPVEYSLTVPGPIFFGTTQSNIKQFMAGIRVGLRFDER